MMTIINSIKISLLITLGVFSMSTQSNAALPGPEFLLAMSQSVAKVHVEDKNGQLGIGSGVVVATNHVATNCHVIAHARGIAVNKLGNSYAPIAMKANWHQDLCILIFDNLPLKPFPLGNIDNIHYEQHIISLGFSGNSPKPIESFGAVKALIPFEKSQMIRTDAGFRMGASGGALIDYNGNLLGLTTFKSPGRQGFYYSLPVDWVKQLLLNPSLSETNQAQEPFWNAPEENRPFFMQAVMPLQNKEWQNLKSISQRWLEKEQQNAEAWYHLGKAEEGLSHFDAAKQALNKTLVIAPAHSSALFSLGQIAMIENNRAHAVDIGLQLEKIDPDFAEYYQSALGLVPTPSN
jgi:serine protease Do